MKDSKKVYWKGLEQLTNRADVVKNAESEFGPAPEEGSGHSRRDFLKTMGFGVAAVSLAACEAPIRKAIPYVQKPVDIDPSLPNYYASTYINGGEYCSIVVKTREGRPIKIDGNALSTVTQGGTNAQVEASVLSLYDNDRLRGPKSAGKKISWEDLDSQVIAKLNEIAGKGGQIRIVSNTVLSPSTLATIERFKAKYSNTQHIQYDQTSQYGVVKANEESFGVPVFPSYDFSKAKTIVSVAADFLNSWGSTIENTKQYGRSREVGEEKKDMSRHYQFESILSITGANADYRSQIKPSEEGAVLIQIYNVLAGKAGRTTISGGIEKAYVAKAAEELWANRGSALVVAGSNDKSIQVVVNAINDILGSYGSTILLNKPVNFKKGDDAAMAGFVADVKGGKIDGVIFYNCNPVYDHPQGADLAEGLKNIALAVSTNYKEEETAAAAPNAYLAPDHHFLESWNDAEPKPGSFSLAQPTITPVFKTRAAQESFLTWAGEQNPDYYQFLTNNWRTRFYRDQAFDFQTFWDKCLYDGVYEDGSASATVVASFAGNVSAAASAIASNYKSEGFELVIFENGSVGNGSQANNPLLQELPDPVTKAVWDHYVTVAPKDAAGITFEESKTRKATITANGKSITVPVLVQPGQAPGTIGVPVGYGRTKAGKVADNLGENAYALVAMVNGSLSYSANAKFEITSDDYQIAQTQTHETYMGRKTVIQETTLDKFQDGSFKKDHYQPMIHTWKDKNHEVDPEKLSIWKNHDYKNHHWGMAIDLNTCTGCGACVVACNVENNVALVGREEVINRREMHWLRIDRYYTSDAPADDWKGAEKASENPEVVFQPMLCQHCNNAPCETVCPVAATTHSTEGINQMTYNRCIGTRYCANNCPYKVRRFNWFKYHDNSQFENVNPQMNSDLGKMVLNPDVTVRSRGVMEKCSFCVQRVQAGKLTAKRERRPLKDGEVVTACAAACSTGAIVFGDFNNPESKVSKLLKIRPLDPERPYINDKESDNPRAYSVLEEINVRPNIFYLTKVRNKDNANA